MDVYAVSYFDFNDKVPTVSCFRHERDAKAYYEHLKSENHSHVSMENCIIYTKIKWEK